MMPLCAVWGAWGHQRFPHPLPRSHGQLGPHCPALPSTPPASVASWTIAAFKSAPHRTFNRPTWHLNTHVPVSNWLLKTAASLQNASITVTVGSDGRQVGARLGREEMGAPGTAVTVCHYGQLSAPAASCHCARHETYSLSDPPAGLSGGCIIN